MTYINKNDERNHNKKYYRLNKEQIKKRINGYRQTRGEDIRAREKKSKQKHKEKNKEYSRNYFQRNKQHKYQLWKQWMKTEKGKRCRARHRATWRKKNWIPILPNIFPSDIPVDWHHIDGMMFVVPLPKKLHRETGGFNLKKHIENANDWIEFYYGMNPTDFLKD